MRDGLEAEILAASQPLQVPGSGERRVLSRQAIERLARAAEAPMWQIEAHALSVDVAPLHYLRNLSRFRTHGQSRLLESRVALVGRGAVLEHAAELLALSGIGRLALLVPVAPGEDEAAAQEAASRAGAGVRNRNPSCAVEVLAVTVQGGNPAELVRGLNAAAACLEDAMEEQLFQFACRMGRIPLVLGAAEGMRGQATTVLPGDPGVALVYKPSHAHLSPKRQAASVSREAGLMVGTWLAEQVTRVLLDEPDLLRGRLLYADLGSGEMTEYAL